MKPILSEQNRFRLLLLVLAVCFIVILLPLRHVLIAYTFDLKPYLIDIPSTLDKCCQPSNETCSKTELLKPVVPKIIHQTWKTATIPEGHWKDMNSLCTYMHPDWEFKLWTDEDARNFIATEFPEALENYDSYPYTIQRVDAIRYYILLKFGGFYLDLDVGCAMRLDALREYELLLPQTEPVGVSNDVMIAAPNSTFFKQLVDELPKWNHYYGTKYPTVFFSTGN